jgi:ubiquitin C-terminal hydrolase
MLGFLELTDRQSFDPLGFFYAFKGYDGKPTNMGIQEDSQEFVNRFFDKLEESLKGTSQKYVIDDIFRGHKLTMLKC